jgi:cell division protein FtsN
MSDQGFREVQLSGKQVVFLFMALAVALIGTFLLGVSVGRHVEPEAVTSQATPTSTPTATDVNPSAPMPPATTPEKGSLVFQQTLRGGGPGNPAPTPTQTSTPTPTPEKPTPTPEKPTPTPSSKPAAPAPANGAATWYVQVNAFSAKANADRQVAELKSKNVTAFVTKAGTLFQVRVGPFERAGADAMHARLEKLGYKPRVTR